MMNITRITSVNEFRPDESLPDSPFRCQNGNTVRKQELETGVSAACLLKDPVNTAILGTVNKLLCATEYQTADALNVLGAVCSYPDIRNRMFRMAGTGLLDHYRYNSEGHTSPHSFFCMGETGYRILKAHGKKTVVNPYQPDAEPVRIMKLLAANQFLTKTGIPADTVRVGEKVRIPGDSLRAFRAHAAAVRDGRTLFLEGVRLEHNWEASLMKKLARVQSVLSDPPASVTDPCMILIGEDTDHCRQIMNLLARERFSFGLLYTSDDLVYSNPDNCLFELAGGLRNRFREGFGLWQQKLGLGN